MRQGNYSLSDFKGRTAIRVFKKFPQLKQKPYWGNLFWAPGYCVDTVGLYAEKIRNYVKDQERREQKQVSLRSSSLLYSLLIETIFIF